MMRDLWKVEVVDPKTAVQHCHNPPNPNYEPLILSSMPETVAQALDMLKQLRSSQEQQVTLVQIGANDGIMYDHLYKTIKDDKQSFLGLFVEPQPDLFSKLAVLHADATDWAFYAGVLSPSCNKGVITFCETKTPGVGNFKTQGQLNGVRDDPTQCNKETMHSVQRPCESSWMELISRHASVSMRERVLEQSTHGTNQTSSRAVVDLIVTDTEGQDLALLQMIDFSKLVSTCYFYEETYLVTGGGHRAREAHDILRKAGYTIRQLKGDVLACRVAPN